MGIDVELYFEWKGNEEPSDRFAKPLGEVKPLSEWKKENHPGATHEVYSLSRYYGAYYERGHWPTIGGVLMDLLSNPDVGKVWYGGDSGDEMPEVTNEEVLRLTLHYLLNGTRPYHSNAPVVYREMTINTRDLA